MDNLAKSLGRVAAGCQLGGFPAGRHQWKL